MEENQNNDRTSDTSGRQPNQEQVNDSKKNETTDRNLATDESLTDKVRNTQAEKGENQNGGTLNSDVNDLNRNNRSSLNGEEDAYKVPKVNNATNDNSEKLKDEGRSEEERNNSAEEDKPGDAHSEGKDSKETLDPNKTRL